MAEVKLTTEEKLLIEKNLIKKQKEAWSKKQQAQAKIFQAFASGQSPSLEMMENADETRVAHEKVEEEVNYYIKNLMF